MSKKKIALIINIIILILELIGLGRWIFVSRDFSIVYYTNDSNIIALIASILFIVFYKKDSEIVKDIRFIATACLTVTILVTVFVLCPMYNFNYKLFMFTDNFLIFHTLVPILSIISYIAFEDRNKKDYLCFLLTVIYGVILIILNILSLIEGPYPFLMVDTQGPVMIIVWAIILCGGSYLIGIALNKLNKKIKGASK